ncbi:MAG: hypothetical protein PUC50_14975 [Bacteroidales bacterium]|nr:hypothetical protein [Bacteroidales bacterium]MDD6003490.1 hypothetical protein [Bacteroidales bacterium]
MVQLVLNVEDVRLVDSLKTIVEAIKGITIDRLIESNQETEIQKKFITDTITNGYNDYKNGNFAGRNLESLDGLINELRAEEV